MIFALLMAAMTLAVTWTIATIPAIASLPLGVSVPQDKRQDPQVQAALRSYRTKVWICGILTTLLTLAAWKWPIVAAFSSLIVVVGAMFSYVTARRRIIDAKAAGKWYDEVETAISARITRTSFTESQLAGLKTTVRFPWISVLGSLLVTAVGAIVVAMRWDNIPETIPTHWGAGLQPDAWSDKSVPSVFIGTFVSLGLIALFAVIFWAMAAFPSHSRNDRSIKGQLRNDTILAASNEGIGLLLLAMCVPLTIDQIAGPLPEFSDWLPVGFYGLLLCSILGVIALLVLIALRASQLDDALRGVSFPDEGKESPDNDEHYKWGMFYYNPDDPAVLVDKRFGVGVTFNFATWQAKAFMAFILLVTVVLCALPALA